MNFFSDITKELLKDVIGQKIYYYPISELKTQSHSVYNEAIKKVFDQPIIIDAMVDAKQQTDTMINAFGPDARFNIEVFIQQRDLIEKGINVCIGDYFSYGVNFFEITEKLAMRNIYGQVEHSDGIKIVGTKARDGQFNAPLLGPTDYAHTDADAVQETFEQQRGQSETSEGQTGDVRDLVRDGVLDASLTGPKEVSPRGGRSDGSNHKSAFYDEE